MRHVLPLLVLFACSTSDAVTPPPNGDDAGQDGAVVDASSCAAPLTLCNGNACVDLSSSAASCGACGYACGGGQSCCSGACSTDCNMSITSVSPAQGPMSGGTWLTIKGKGFGAGARVLLGKSRAPANVIDAQTLMVLTPPGLAGDVDVQVKSGSSTSTKAKAFRYGAYGFKGPWAKINMSSARGNWPGISVMQDGKVLITGGVTNGNGASVEDTADVYDPSTTKSTAAAGKMSTPRWTQTQVTLFNGDALVLGTWFGGYSPPTGPIADLFDPTTGKFKPTVGKPSLEHRWPHSAMLADGRVLVVSYTTPTPEIYDPAKDGFAPLANAPDLTGYRPTRLLDGRVLFVKGAHAPVRIYDPDASSWSTAGQGPTATDGDVYTLPDGRVLVVAGTIATSQDTSPTNVLELFDPAQNKDFVPASYHLIEPRQATLTSAMLGDGTVLVIGGEVGKNVAIPACSVNSFTLTDGVERIDPVGGAVSAFDKLPEKNFVMSGATLQDGSVVAAGGAPCGGGDAYPYFYFLQGTPPPK